MGGQVGGILCPDEWERKNPHITQVFTLEENDQQWTHVVKAFMDSMPQPHSSIIPIKVERIENLSRWQSYAMQRERVRFLSSENSSHYGEIERRWLFHGTTADMVPSIKEGCFKSSKSCIGEDIHFTRDAKRSLPNSEPDRDHDHVRHMFLCRVVVGKSCHGERDPLQPYDSYVDKIDDPSLFMVLHNSQAYPEYLVHFKLSTDK